MPKSDAIAGRLQIVLGDESVNSFARRCGIGEALLRKYLAGSMPGADKLAIIARVSGASLLWLATGEGPMRQSDLAAEVAESRPAYGAPVDVKHLPRVRFCTWLQQWWEQASDDERAWMRIELEHKFPDFAEWLKKTGQGSSSGQSSA